MSDEGAAMNAALERCTTSYEVTVFRSEKTKRVLFLEAGDAFVDTLFSFLLLPVGTILNILSQGIEVNPSLGGMSSIYKSVDSSFLRGITQGLLGPRPASVSCFYWSSLKDKGNLEVADILQLRNPEKILPQLYYRCTRCCHFSCSAFANCEVCVRSNYSNPSKHSDGPYYAVKRDANNQNDRSGSQFVKENMAFIVTDKLEIIPSTMNSSVSMLKRLEVASFDELESNKITVGITEILQLLHSALSSSTCLNDVFGLRK